MVNKNDIGIEFIVNTNIVLTAATTLELIVKKPNGDIDTWTGAIYNVNYIRYVTTSGDIDEDGDYEAQAHVILGALNARGKIFRFNGAEILE